MSGDESIRIDTWFETLKHGSDPTLQKQGPIDAATVHKLKKAIRSKRWWEEKINDEVIVKRYRTEAIAQGASAEAVEEALGQLREEAATAVFDHAPSSSSQASAPQPVAEAEFQTLRYQVSSLQPRIPLMMREGLEEKNNSVWYVDNAVPSRLREILESRLDAIASLPEKDFHPGSNDQVQDLIHPSLFPYIDGISPLKEKATLPNKNSISYWRRRFEDSMYQWLPAQFFVAPNGDVEVTSYINNLEEAPNQELYQAIELVFGLFLPMFEKILKTRLRSREVQVIVKAANYVIQPNGSVFEGQWHVEGMSHEHIVASGIYYYSTSRCLQDGGLEFRRQRDEENDYPEILKYHVDDEDAPDTEGLQHNIHLGAVPTVQNRLLAFSNELQHKVSKIRNASTEQVGTRKILVFFLVNPDVQIVSTKHIVEQQYWERRVPLMAGAVRDAALALTGKMMPTDVLHKIVGRAKDRMSMEEARQHRLKLMEARTVRVASDNEDWEREYSLCEH